jgi:subtilase family serine protease
MYGARIALGVLALVVGAGTASAGPREVMEPRYHRAGHGGGGSSGGVNGPFTPGQVVHAYGIDLLRTSGGLGSDGTPQGAVSTIAIVDAYDDPTIASDLDLFSNAYGLPLTSTGFFTKTWVGHAAGTPAPAGNQGWAGEIALDCEWAHAIAPGAKILLVEARSASNADLLAAVDLAIATPGVDVVSMSWDGNEFSGETTSLNDGTFLAKGVSFFAASGDSGEGSRAEWPAVSPLVTAVGGTNLTLSTSGNNWQTEVAWSGSGGGVSLYEPAQGYQTSSWLPAATARVYPDVAWIGGSLSTVYVYDTYGSGGLTAFYGTSESSPQFAALVHCANCMRAAAGKPVFGNDPNDAARALYLNNNLYGIADNEANLQAVLHDITSGSNGRDSEDATRVGYDAVTGLGTPRAAALVNALVER